MSSTVLLYHDVLLKSEDVSLLTGPHWLNDQLIAFYFQYMEHHMFKKHSKKFLFVPPSITQLIKIGTEDARTFLDPLKADSKDVLFFAVNDNQDVRAGGQHWSLLVFSRNEETFFSFDSLRNFNGEATLQLVNKLKQTFAMPRADFVKMNSLQQNNAYDCGVYLLANAEAICHYYLQNKIVRAPTSPEIARQKREEILTVIRQLAGNRGEPGPSYLN